MTDHTLPRRNRAPGQPPVRALLAAASAALALHAWLLGALPGLNGLPPQGAPGEADAAQPMTVRQIVRTWPAAPQPAERVLPSPAPAAPVPQDPARTPSPPAEAARAVEPEPAPASETAAGAPVAAAASAASAAQVPTVAEPAPADPASATAPPALAIAASAEPPATGSPPLTYRTQPAPPATMTFDFRRGLASGQAVLQWRPDTSAGLYTLTLQAQAFGIALAGWNSSGRFDAAGLAPERYAETRRSREVRATNFQRAAGTISFSALPAEFPLVSGVQDRSSWMLQLGAILQANPELAQPGAQVTMVVVGTRGAPEPWVFTVMGHGELVLSGANSGGTVANAVHLKREPRRPYDTRADVWLDPARHHLPMKVLLVVAATGEGQEFELRQLSMP